MQYAQSLILAEAYAVTLSRKNYSIGRIVEQHVIEFLMKNTHTRAFGNSIKCIFSIYGKQLNIFSYTFTDWAFNQLLPSDKRLSSLPELLWQNICPDRFQSAGIWYQKWKHPTEMFNETIYTDPNQIKMERQLCDFVELMWFFSLFNIHKHTNTHVYAACRLLHVLWFNLKGKTRHIWHDNRYSHIQTASKQLFVVEMRFDVVSPIAIWKFVQRKIAVFPRNAYRELHYLIFTTYSTYSGK